MRTHTLRFKIVFPLVLMLAIGFLIACGTTPEPTAAPPAASDAAAGETAMTDEAMADESMEKMDEAMTDESMEKMDEAMTDESMEKMDEAMMAQEKELVSGWYQGDGVEYYEFGSHTPLNGQTPGVAPIFAFIHGTNADGSPNFVEGQHNIVDVVPGDAGYSDLWQVFLVTVPQGYVADSIKSKADLDSAGYAVTATSIFVNCPIVPEGTQLEGGEELTQGWYKGQAVFYPDFGENPVIVAPIWAFITGMDSEGNPQFVEGQRNVIDVVPGDAGYSAFWLVNLVVVPEDYTPNSIKSAAEIMTSGYEIMATDLLVNCPVVSTQT